MVSWTLLGLISAKSRCRAGCGGYADFATSDVPPVAPETGQLGMLGPPVNVLGLRPEEDCEPFIVRT
jgi:hypothetical protein